MKKVFSIPFGADFLDALHRLIMEDGKELSSLAIVFAGKRPSLYLKKRFSEGAERPIYSPQFFSIEEFIDFIARKQYPDFTDIEYADAIWLLYQCIQSLPSFAGHPFREKGFGDFFWWGRYLLEFINQLDTENIDNDKLRSLEKNAELGYDVPSFYGTLFIGRFMKKSSLQGGIKTSALCDASVNQSPTISKRYISRASSLSPALKKLLFNASGTPARVK
jgi:hypothetical protein